MDVIALLNGSEYILYDYDDGYYSSFTALSTRSDEVDRYLIRESRSDTISPQYWTIIEIIR